MEKALEELAIKRAQELGCSLLTLNLTNQSKGLFKGVVESLGSCAPFEYVDGVQGITEGVFQLKEDLEILYEEPVGGIAQTINWVASWVRNYFSRP